MNFQEWVEQVRAFSMHLRNLPGDVEARIEIDPPLSHEECDQLAVRWPRGIPAVLRRLWIEGSARIDCPYWWTPPENEQQRLKEMIHAGSLGWAGVRFEPAAKIYPGNSGADPADQDMLYTLGSEGHDLICRCAIFYIFLNGDCLGLDPRTNPDDPAVVFLAHDDKEHPTLANSFTEFLIDWETLCYITPEWWTLARARANAKELQALFRCSR